MVAPLEIVALNARPIKACVDGAVCGCIEAADVQRVRRVGIDGDIVNVLRLDEDWLPGCAGVGRKIDTAAPCPRLLAPFPRWPDTCGYCLVDQARGHWVRLRFAAASPSSSSRRHRRICRARHLRLNRRYCLRCGGQE